MDLEICSLPADDRPKFKTQLESFRAELKRLAKEFQSAKRRFIRKNDRFQFLIIMKVECVKVDSFTYRLCKSGLFQIIVGFFGIWS